MYEKPTEYTNLGPITSNQNNQPSPYPIEMQIFGDSQNQNESSMFKSNQTPFFRKNRQDFLDVSRLERKRDMNEPLIEDDGHPRTSIRESIQAGIQKGMSMLSNIKDELTGDKKNKVDENQERKILLYAICWGAEGIFEKRTCVCGKFRKKGIFPDAK